MLQSEKFPTLLDNEKYLIFRSDDKETVALVDHGRGISLMFPHEEWHEFSRVIVAAANKDCELNEADEQARVIEVSVIDSMMQKAIDPLLKRINDLEQELHEPTECNPEDNYLDMLERCAIALSQKRTDVKEEFLIDVRNVIKKARGEKECDNIDEDSNEEPETT